MSGPPVLHLELPSGNLESGFLLSSARWLQMLELHGGGWLLTSARLVAAERGGAGKETGGREVNSEALGDDLTY